MNWRITRSSQIATYRPTRLKALADAKELAKSIQEKEVIAVWERDEDGTQRCILQIPAKS